jgi:type II secretory pathway predicted ATPase ExeA
MDPVINPFTPGSGHSPPFLAGRDAAIAGFKIGHATQNFVLSGLRGVGKTVLLRVAQNIATQDGIQTTMLEAGDDRSLRGQLASRLRQILLRLDLTEKVKKALSVVASFASAVRLKHGELELALDVDPAKGIGDSGNLEDDLVDLFLAVGTAAQDKKTAVAIFIDEMQDLKSGELTALIMATHKVAQHSLPLILIGGGLPQMVAHMGAARGYSERLFQRIDVGSLDEESAREAIKTPLAKAGASIKKAALDDLIRATLCYPYFLQEWGKHSWNCAKGKSISAAAVRAAHPLATASLDESFFRFRFDQLTEKEKRYARAMASLGKGPQKSGDIAAVLGVNVQSLGPIRKSMIEKGTIYSPVYGDTDFTVPLFNEFMLRVMPNFQKSSANARGA